MVNILVVRQQNNQLGDTICALPMFYALKKKFPDSRITLLRGPVNYDIDYATLIPMVDDVYVVDRYASAKNKLKLIKTLRRKKFNYGIVPSTYGMSSTSHIVNFLSGAKKKVGLSYAGNKRNPYKFLLNIKKPFNWNERNISQAMRGVEIVEQIGCTITNEEIENITLKLDKINLEFANKFIKSNFNENKLLIGIHPGGKVKNRWSANNFASVIEKIAKQNNSEFLITSGDIDMDSVEELSWLLKDKNINFTIAQSFDIKDLSAIMRKFNLYICNDTGILHLASLNKVKTIGLFGPTSSTEWKPIGKDTVCIQSPTGDINDISVEKVIEAASEILK